MWPPPAPKARAAPTVNGGADHDDIHEIPSLSGRLAGPALEAAPLVGSAPAGAAEGGPPRLGRGLGEPGMRPGTGPPPEG